MFWMKRKSKTHSCNHQWHHLRDSYITYDTGCMVDGFDGCYIFCPKCKKEKPVYKEEWERIQRKQEILAQYVENEKE